MMLAFDPADPNLHFLKRQLPAPALQSWCDGANAARGLGLSHNECIKAGWDMLKEGWERPAGQPMYRRIRKDSPGPSDVHVNAPLNGKRPKRKDEDLEKADEQTLYVNRPLLNGDAIRAWAAEQGIASTLAPDDMHVTIAYSKAPVDWDQFEPDDRELTIEDGRREIHQFPARTTENGALVLIFEAPALNERWQEFRDGGASWDFPEYHSHITITYSVPAADLDTIEPYTGPLVFGPEEFEPLNENWANEIAEQPLEPDEDEDMNTNKAGARHSRSDQTMLQNIHDHAVSLGATCASDMEKRAAVREARVVKVDEEQHMVYGWASVTTYKGEPIIDHQGDIIEPQEMEKAATDFMKDLRTHGDMHQWAWVMKEDELVHEPVSVGTVVHSFPLTEEIMKALGIYSPAEGWIVGVHVTDPGMWKRYKSGELTGFSIGGSSLFEELE